MQRSNRVLTELYDCVASRIGEFLRVKRGLSDLTPFANIHEPELLHSTSL